MACFDEHCQYDDTAFRGPPANRATLRKRFQRSMEFLPKNIKLIIDKVANDPVSGNMGAQWHLETAPGRPIPFSRGTSFYTTNAELGLITTGFRIMESPIKPDDAVFNALAIPFRIVEGVTGSSTANNKARASPPQDFDDSMTLMEKFYDGWNRRDIQASLQYAAEDIQYEDLLYSKPFSGKRALRKHLERVTKQLPSACKIVIDNQTVDPSNGNIGVVWHLEIENGQLLQAWSRGCSMYTTDGTTGLITSGFDVTEPPLKADERGLDLLFVPFQAFRSL